jgi:hypothetical protein
MIFTLAEANPITFQTRVGGSHQLSGVQNKQID